MKKGKRKVSDLQEILFWQQLNKQLIELRGKGKPINDQHHKYLQEFCLENRSFSKITQNSLIDEIPLALISDLADTSFVTINLEPWNNCLAEIIPNAYIFDVERALADAFDVLGEYDRKYGLVEKSAADEDEDEELFGFINDYLRLRGEQRRDFPGIVRRLYELKAASVRNIMEKLDYKQVLGREGSLLSFDVQRFNERDTMLSSYFDSFCKEALSLVEPVKTALNELDLYGLLHSKQAEGKVKPSVKEFVEYEVVLVERESALFDRVIRELKERVDQKHSYRINICDTSSFFFLDHPFPLA